MNLKPNPSQLAIFAIGLIFVGLPNLGVSAKPPRPAPLSFKLRQGFGGYTPIATNELVARITVGQSAALVAKRTGLKVLRKSLVKNATVFSSGTVAQAQSALTKLSKDPGVASAFHNRILRSTRIRQFAPNDPFFANNFPVGGPGDGWPGQWFLVNGAARATGDVNVLPQWTLNTTGVGVTVGIVDDGVESGHPDLAPGYLQALSLNAETGVKGGTSGDPIGAASNHGTFTAGAAIARGGNGIGITGSAPLASWTAIRLPIGGNTLTDEMDVAAIEHESVTSSLISIKNHSYGGSTPFVDSPASRAALARSAANGTIHVYAAGNDRGQTNQDATKDGSTSSPDVIVVGALASTGLFASYSSMGSNLVCTAYGGDGGDSQGQIGTDRQGLTVGYSANANFLFPDGNGNYAANQAGTSFTAPTVTGIIALAKQRQPGLNVRWAKHLFATTSRLCDPMDATPVGGWTTNAGGVKFNPNYGFGLVDADAFVRAAQSSTGVTAVSKFDSGTIAVNTAIPDNGSLSRTFSVTSSTPLEEVLLTLNVAHRSRGQLRAFLTSPRGTTHRVFLQSNGDTGADINWTFNMNGFWGENPNGTWTVRIDDAVAGIDGQLNSMQLRLNMGTLTRVVL